MSLQYPGVTKPIQTSQEGTIKVSSLTQTNKESEQWNPYQIKFTPLNPIPSTGAIQLTWPPQVNINTNQTNCFVQTNKVFNNTCTINADARTIIIKGAFAEVGLDGWSQNVTISLNDVQNPPTNKIGTGFGIRTYADSNIQYNIDEMPNTILIPLLNCMFPCRTCNSDEPSVCTSCWLKDTDEIKAQFFNRLNENGGGVCESSCRDGTTSDGDPNKVCVACDPSCAKCLDLGLVGDKRRCIQCSQTFPFRIDGKDTCMTKCTDGFYESVTGTTCSYCNSPCSTCKTTASTCTKCGVDPFLPLLFTKEGQPPQCLNTCPSGYTAVSGRCEKCNDPCATCEGTVNNCLTCSGTNATKYVFNGVCYPECPAGTTETQTSPNCLACQSGCDKCNDKDQSICLRCSAGLLVHLGGCVAGCPKDYVTNKEKTSCVPWSLNDLKKIYFPFLGAACIAILIVLFGMCKKKEKAFTKVSITQHTVTCILVAIAPLQWLACAAQAVLAYLYGVQIHFYLAAAVFATYCVINFAFEIMYDVQFNRTVKTQVTMELKAKYAEQQKRKKNGEKLTSKEVTLAQINQSQEPNDRLFNQHKKDHGFQFCLISSLTFLVSFKFNKMYYSHFYSFGMFKAKFSNANHYRKVHTWYSMIHMFLVDLFLICIGITGLITIEFMKNQLYIIFIETVVLSVLDIILGGYELFKLKEYLVYTEPKKIGKTRAKVSSALIDEDEENPKKKRAGLSAFYEEFDENSRAEMIQGLIYKVQANKNLFLNNKLDELLDLFGDRRCKSMIELGTGWDKEEDPRKIITIPMSPTLLLEKYDGEYHFGLNDMYGGQDDNCYAEVIIKDPGIDTAVQGDQGQQDFNQALQRKQADFLDPVKEDDELMNRKSKGKRRGRKNKYYAQIDNEDDVDAADAVEPQVNEESEEEDNEALILEQQREEEALRQKVEEERLKQEQLKAQRKAALLEAEQKRRLAEEAEELARLKAEEEEEALRVAQEQLEQERLKELENARLLMKQEEQEEKLRRERLERERKEELAKMSEANRIKYEEEEAKRLAELKQEEQRIAKEAEEAEKKAKLARDEEQRLKREAAEKLRAERDAAELARIQEQLAYEEKQRNEAKEAERLRLETEELQRKQKALELQDQVRKQKEEELRLKMEQDEKDRQLRFSQHEAEMQKQLLMEAELKKRKEEEEAAYKKRKADEEAAFRKQLIEQNENERARLIAEQETLRKQLEAEMEAARLMREQEMEKLRKLREAEDEARKKQIEEEEKIRHSRLAEEEQARIARIAAEEAARLAEQENRISKLEAETEARRLQEEENRKKKNAEDQKREAKRLEELKAEEDKILKHKLSIEAEAKRLQEEKDKVKKDDLARKEKLILEEAAKLDRERLEEQKKAEIDKARLREQQKSEMDRIEKEAAELERKEIIRTERARLEQEKAHKERLSKDKAADLARQEKDRLEAEARAAPPRAESRIIQENPKTLANAGIQVASDKVENRGNKEIAQKVPASRSSTLEQENSRVEFGNDKNLKAFEAKEANLISIPDADKRNFNVHDVLGDWERDDKGNVIVVQDKAGNEVDKQGRPTNNRGYLINPRTGDIVEGLTGRNNIYFSVEDLDDRGELPAPFCVEKYNFNPHDLQGDLDFDFDHESQLPIPRLLQTKQGFFVDKKGRRINKHGWLVNQNGHIVDKLGRTRFDRRQLEDGDLQRLYNYHGKRFDIKDVIGVFEKNKQNGDILTISSKDGKFLEDNFGRRVNEKGYLIDHEGNIIDKEGRKIWNSKDLKNGDFIKIFQFTKFNINNVIGDFEMSPLTDPILEKDANGNFIDRKGRLVNARGYLIDLQGNIIDKYGKKMFDKSILSADGELPKVFRINLLKSDSSSSLSELMREIEKNQPSEFDEETKSIGQPPRPRQQQMHIEQEEGDGDTSVDSLMEDTPANYNVANQRFEEHYDDYEPGQANDQRPQQQQRQQRKQRVQQQVTEQPEYYANPDMPKVKRKKKKAKKPKPQMLEYLMPTKREVNMADAYGGNAKGQFRRPGVKYDKERLMNRIKTPANIPGGRAQLEALANTVAGFHQQKQMASIPENLSARGGFRPPIVRRNEFVNINDYDRSNRSHDEGHLNNSVQHAPNDMLGSKRKLNQHTAGNRSKSNLPRGQKMANRTGNFNEMDFEKVLGKDIDQFLEDSEWDIESYEKMSQFSRGSERNHSQDHRLKAMEKVYLQKVEKDQDDSMFQSGPKTHVTGKNSNTTGPTTLGGTRKKYAPREFQDRFTNDAPFIARGQGPLEFETAIQAKPEKSNSRSPPRDGVLRGPIAQEANRVSKQVLQPPRK